MKFPSQLDDFNFELPSRLIAQHPLPVRTDSRLLLLNREQQTIQHQQFNQIIDHLNANDLLVFNDTKVMPARLWGKKSSGGNVECLIEKILGEKQALAHLRANKSIKLGAIIQFAEAILVKILDRKDRLFLLEFLSEGSVFEQLQQYGQLPLPRYITRSIDLVDHDRYQTVYARQLGAVAAPTAGLHFNQEILIQLQAKGIEFAYITLHVGAGTFSPVRTTTISEHKMHSEYREVSEQTCQAIIATQARGGRVIAVGTTVARSLESAVIKEKIQPSVGETDIFIRPGFQFQCIDGLLTNFHLPKSTLLMLVSAWAGYSLMMQAYQEAIAKDYRFFSYGDAMLIL